MTRATTGNTNGDGSRASLQGSLWQRFRLLPRAAQWAIIGGGAIVLLFLYSDYVLATANAWNEEANERQQLLTKARMINDSARVGGSLGDAIKAIGEVEVPDDEAATSAALTTAVSDIVKKYQVSNHRFNTATPGKLPRGTMGSILGDREARYISGNVEFESSVESAGSIIADLESSPAVESISALRITKSNSGQRRVNVRLTIESWVMAPAGKATARGTVR